jgi:single-strand DNA-binding protein
MILSKPQLTLTGNLTRDPRTLSEEPARVAFGLAVNPERRDAASEQWVPDGDVQYYDVVCFGSLAANVRESLSKGDPVLVVGGLRRRGWQRTDGTPETTYEIAADAVAPDLRRGTTHFRRTRRGAPPAEQPTAEQPTAHHAQQEGVPEGVDARTGELVDA